MGGGCAVSFNLCGRWLCSELVSVWVVIVLCAPVCVGGGCLARSNVYARSAGTPPRVLLHVAALCNEVSSHLVSMTLSDRLCLYSKAKTMFGMMLTQVIVMLLTFARAWYKVDWNV